MKQKELVLTIWKEWITNLLETPKTSLISNEKTKHKISSLEAFYCKQYEAYIHQKIEKTRVFKYLTTKIPTRMHVIFISIVFKLNIHEVNELLFQLRMVKLRHSFQDVLLTYALENADVSTYFLANELDLEFNEFMKQEPSSLTQYLNKHKHKIMDFEKRKEDIITYFNKTMKQLDYNEEISLTNTFVNNLLPYTKNREKIRMNIYNFMHKEHELFTNRNYFVVYCIGLGLNPYEINDLLNHVYMTSLNIYPEERFIYDFLLNTLKHNPFIFANEFEYEQDTIENNEIYCIGEEITNTIHSFQNERCDIEKYICRMYA